MPRTRAFTLVEVLVVIGILAALMGILLPSISRARQQAMEVRCAANLRSNGQALVSYAVENKSRFPAHAGQGKWLWDLPHATRDAMVRSGMSRDTMHCPSNEDLNADNLWDGASPSQRPFVVTGYFWLTPRIGGEYPPDPDAGVASPIATTASPNFTRLAYQKRLVSIRSTEVELATDATLSIGNSSAIGSPPAQDGDFVDLASPYPLPNNPAQNRTVSTNHVNGNDRPRGGNVLYMDGHVAWRPFGEMKMRFQFPTPPIQFWY